jgi:hypothetical protein
VQHRLQLVIGRRDYLDEFRRAVDTQSVHPVQHQAVQVNVQVGRGAEALDGRDRAAVGPVALETRLPEQVARDHGHHRRHRLLTPPSAPGATQRSPHLRAVLLFFERTASKATASA